MHTVVETPDYLRDVKEAGLTADEREGIVLLLAEAPASGDIIKGTGGARKLRVAGRGKGKSGGYRVVTFYGGHDPVFLLNLFAKSEKVNLSKAERNELAKVLGALADAYKKGVARHVQKRRTDH